MKLGMISYRVITFDEIKNTNQRGGIDISNRDYLGPEKGNREGNADPVSKQKKKMVRFK